MNIKFRTIILLGLSLIILSCSKEADSINLDDLTAPEYDLPRGEPGSVDEKIYNIHQKYGTFILYDFEETDLYTLWASSWTKWHAPADKSDNLRHVGKIVDLLDDEIFASYEPEFIRDNFPYKVFVVDSLCDNYQYSERYLRDILSNGNNAIAISNAGPVSDDWTENQWNKLKADINNAFTLFYYEGLDEKPIQFMALAYQSLLIPRLNDPLDEIPQYEYSCYSVGAIRGRLGTTYLAPNPEEEFADYIHFLTTNTGTFLNRVFERFELLKTRAILLNNFLVHKMNMDLVATQNINHPDDKITSALFE